MADVMAIVAIAVKVRDASEVHTSSSMRYPTTLFQELNETIRAYDRNRLGGGSEESSGSDG